MTSLTSVPEKKSLPSGSALLELIKPITWFAPMWAFTCGVISSQEPIFSNLFIIALGVILAGPLVCGGSQAINDWFDRHVDAINEPLRPIPSGRVPGRWGLGVAVAMSLLALGFAYGLGIWAFGATVVGVVLAWCYSAPPLRLKRNGWWGNAAVALSYEGLAWFTGAAILTASFPDWRIVTFAALFSLGAHGIMTLNDFKSVEGDRRMKLRSLPVMLGEKAAARLACVTMAVPQVVVLFLLFTWDRQFQAIAMVMLLGVQILLMVRFLRDPKRLAPWYNATGTTLFVAGMMISAFALRGL